MNARSFPSEVRFSFPCLVLWTVGADGNFSTIHGPGMQGAPQKQDWFVGKHYADVCVPEVQELIRLALGGTPAADRVIAWGKEWFTVVEPTLSGETVTGVSGTSVQLPEGTCSAAHPEEAETFVCRHPIRAGGMYIRAGAFVNFTGDHLIISEVAPDSAVAPILQHVGSPRLERLPPSTPPSPISGPPPPLRLVPR
jgi:hypothetical protein